MKVLQFEISILAGDGILIVGVRVPTRAGEDDIASVMSTVVEAFASIEPLDDEEMRALLIDAAHAAVGREGVPDGPLELVLRREYTDPHYPAKFDCALQRLTSVAPTLH